MNLLRGIALLLVAIGLVIVPVYAQDGSGVVVIGNLSGSSDLSPLPIGCAADGLRSDQCAALSDLCCKSIQSPSLFASALVAG